MNKCARQSALKFWQCLVGVGIEIMACRYETKLRRLRGASRGGDGYLEMVLFDGAGDVPTHVIPVSSAEGNAELSGFR